MINDELKWTGERLITTVKSYGVIEHLHRYAIVSNYVKDKIVLDIASGEGYGSNLLSFIAKQVIGVDICEKAITFANKKYGKSNLSFKEGTVQSIPLNDSSVDVIISFETLEHVSEQELMLREIKRVLKPDGVLVMSSPEKANYRDLNEWKNHFHIKELYIHEFEKLIKRYFSNYKLLFQKTIYGSLIVPSTNKSNDFIEFRGDFNSISSYNGLKNPVFNICIASNNELSTCNISFFDAQEYYDLNINDLKEQIKSILNSKNYRLGKLILYPFRKFRNFLKK